MSADQFPLLFDGHNDLFCMVATSLGVAPGVLLAQDADFIDQDGHLILDKGRSPGLLSKDHHLLPPSPALWG